MDTYKVGMLAFDLIVFSVMALLLTLALECDGLWKAGGIMFCTAVYCDFRRWRFRRK